MTPFREALGEVAVEPACSLERLLVTPLLSCVCLWPWSGERGEAAVDAEGAARVLCSAKRSIKCDRWCSQFTRMHNYYQQLRYPHDPHFTIINIHEH